MKRGTIFAISRVTGLLCLPALLAGLFFAPPKPVQASGAALPYQIYLPAVQRYAPPALVTPGEGGGGQGFNGQVTVTIPAGAVPAPANLSITAGCDITPPLDVSDSGMCVRIDLVDTASGQPVHTLFKPAVIEFNIAGLRQSYITLTDLAIFHSSQGSAWAALADSQVNLASNIVRGTTQQFSTFGLFAPVNPQGYTPGGVAVDAGGRLYWVDYMNWAIMRQSPGDEPEIYHDVTKEYTETSFDAGDLEIDKSSGVLFYTNSNSVWRLAPGQEVATKLYERDLTGDIGVVAGDHINGIDLDTVDGTLYVARKRVIVQIDASTGAEIRSLGPLPSTFLKGTATSEAQDVVISADRRIFAISRDLPVSPVSFGLWGNMYVYTEGPPSAGWLEVAYGFAMPFALEADAAGNIYVTNTLGHAISVVSGADPAVTGFIKNVNTPRGLVISGGNLLTAAYGQVTSIPASRRDPSQAGLQVEFEPASGNLSGAGSLIALKITNPEPIPAHHSLKIGDTVIRRLASIQDGVYKYQLVTGGNWRPQALGEPADWLTVRSGAMQFRAGFKVINGPWFHAPELGAFHSHDLYNGTMHIARGEWLTWSSSIYQGASLAESVISSNGLFPDWDPASGGEWLAYQFTQNGDYTFSVTRHGGTPQAYTVHVSSQGPGNQWASFQVDPQQGATLYVQSAQLVIPPHALPGSAAYTVTFGAIGSEHPATDKFTPQAMSHKYYAEYSPEPERLNATVTLRMPYDPAMVSEGQIRLGFYEANLNDFIQIDCTRNGEYVELTYPAGEYKEVEINEPSASGSGDAAAPAFHEAAASAAPSFKLRGKINAVFSYLRWFVGMPNEQVYNEHFSVFYNTLDWVDESYAQQVLDEMEYAYQFYFSKGFTMPKNRTLVKIAPWATSRDTPGLTARPGDVTRWFNIYIHHQLSPEGIQAVTAHEFFHVIQHTTMSTVGRESSPRWWLESTAMWAQREVHPNNPDFNLTVVAGADFINQSFNTWTAMPDTELYATGVFSVYLEETHSGAILRIFQNVGWFTSFTEALEQEVGVIRDFYKDFAYDYLTLTSPFLSGYNLEAAIQNVDITGPVTPLVAKEIPPLAAGMQRVRYIPVGAPPFSDYDGSVLRAAKTCGNGLLYALDANKREIGRNIIGSQDPNYGILMAKLSTYTTASPLYLLYINVDDENNCAVETYLESPTIRMVSPNQVKVGDTAIISITGGGFGPVQGTTNIGTILAWSENLIVLQFQVTLSHYPEVYLYVNHANYPSSNHERIVVAK